MRSCGMPGVLSEGWQRVDRRPAQPHLEMEMRARRKPRSADEAQLRARGDHLPRMDVHLRKVRVERREAAAVLDDDEVAVPARAPSSEADRPARGRVDRVAEPGNDVDPGMERGAARPEGAADDPDERPAEPQRRLRDRLLEARQGLRTRYTVRRETGPALEALQRPLGVEPERAVEDPARKAVRGEQELERRDVLPAL